MHTKLPTIDSAQLSTVTGGAATTDTNQAMMTALNGIVDSLKQLQTPPKSGMGMQEMMMVMMMSRRR
jgi:hypothetical protein